MKITKAGKTMEILRAFCVLVLSTLTFGQDSCPNYEKMPNNLREMIIGSCSVFQYVLNQELFCQEGFRNCTEIWEAFQSAFIDEPQCNVSDTRYNDYVKLTHHTIPKDKSLFWENVWPWITRFSGHGVRYMSLGDTLQGYIADGKTWCSKDGQLSPPGTLCPSYDPTPACPQAAVRAFWIALSKDYAESVSGLVTVLFNASVEPIFANDTYFAVYELPYWKRGAVESIEVVLLNESPRPERSKCLDPSLEEMKLVVEDQGFTYDCVENRRDVVTMWCLDYPEADICKTISTVSSSPHVLPLLFTNIMTLIVALTFNKYVM